MELFLDLETRSPIDLKKLGVYRYVEEVEILLSAWAVDDGPVRVDEGLDDALVMAAKDADVIVAHNAEFDRTVISKFVPWMAGRTWHCTMAQARRHSLPGGLDKLSTIFNLGAHEAKMGEERKLVLLFCKPRPDGTWATKDTHPAEWARFKAYARNDITSMRRLKKLMPTWNDEFEAPIWQADQVINARGFAVDTAFARTVVETLAGEKRESRRQAQEMTGGYLSSLTQRDKLLAWLLVEHGVDLPDLGAATIERRLQDEELPDATRELLRLRLTAAKASPAKYTTLLNCTSPDGRMRGTLTYSGALRTQRWAGNRFQPHNLPRLSGGVTPEDVEVGVQALKAGVADLVCEIPVPQMAAFAVRGCVIAPPGKKLAVGDFASVEGRGVAWLAGETWKLQAFSAYDRGEGPDLYKVAYAKAFGVLPDAVTKEQRQIGKVMELMLGYEGGVGAFITGSETYRIDLDKMAALALPAVPGRVLAESEKSWEWAVENKNTFGLAHDTYLACDSIKRLWRKAHPRIEHLWWALEDACKTVTLMGPGAPAIQVGPLLTVDRVGNWLRILLPSGRYLSYPAPRVVGGKLSYMGQNQYTRQWSRISTYGGKTVENATQGVCRDLLAEAILRCEEDDYPVVLHVHDEIASEIDEDVALGGFLATVSESPDWARGMPIAVSGFETTRYRKE